MITAKLKGGLGNQLYQIAAAYSLAKKHNQEFFINYELEHGAMQGRHPKSYKTNLFKNFKSSDDKVDMMYIERKFRHHEIPFVPDTTYAIDGYFQSYLYFKDIINELREKITFTDTDPNKVNLDEKVKTRLDKFRNEGKHVIGVHTRGGDYKLNPDIFPIPSEKYYRRAMSKFNPDNTVYLYCTDDVQTLSQFTFDKNNIHVNGDELLEFCILSHCDSLIMANSSFSAWASYLVKDKYQVFCPKVWFGKSVDATDLYDPSWTIL